MVRCDQEKVWHASYTDAPQLEFGGTSPSEALWKLFGNGFDLSVDPRTIVAVEPDSMTWLNFTVEDAEPSSAHQSCGMESEDRSRTASPHLSSPTSR
jgi:hypothetical protein